MNTRSTPKRKASTSDKDQPTITNYFTASNTQKRPRKACKSPVDLDMDPTGSETKHSSGARAEVDGLNQTGRKSPCAATTSSDVAGTDTSQPNSENDTLNDIKSNNTSSDEKKSSLESISNKAQLVTGKEESGAVESGGESPTEFDSQSHEADAPLSDWDTDDTPEDMGCTGTKERKRPYRVPLRSSWSGRDTEEYRSGYLGKVDDTKKCKNLKFYRNEMLSVPDGNYIDGIHETWYDNYELLERHHGYIQWLFPIRESGMNYQAQELQSHEKKAINEDKAAMRRFRKSYEMMLGFYGIQLKNPDTGFVERAENWKPRFKHLNQSFHNYLRITRILKCLGELGHEHYKAPLIKFFLTECLIEETLPNVTSSCVDYWIHTLRNEEERMDLAKWASTHM